MLFLLVIIIFLLRRSVYGVIVSFCFINLINIFFFVLMKNVIIFFILNLVYVLRFKYVDMV